MPQLAVPRKGWENEHLATFLLSRIAFVSQPVTVADDVGSDFFCALFEPRDREGTELLFPVSSFAIQVKSRREKVDVTNKIEYLSSLELPLFLGVLDRSRISLSLYSGEYLPMMLCHQGIPGQLTLWPLDQSERLTSRFYDGVKGGPCNLRLPFVLELAADDEQDELRDKVRKLTLLCSRMHRNISTWRVNENIFELDSVGQVVIMAGEGSAQTFRQNLYLRLAEVFYNLEWLMKERPSEFNVREFEAYDRL